MCYCFILDAYVHYRRTKYCDNKLPATVIKYCKHESVNLLHFKPLFQGNNLTFE